AMIALFDNTITFHSRYQQSHEVAALLDLLVLERDNPRSLGWVAQTLRSRLARLAGRHPGEFDELAMLVPDPHQWTLESVCQLNADGSYAVLAQLLMACTESTWRVSDEINHRYFTHTTAYGQSLLT
ncbi:MAG: alpha-E domain-containing protein, partial [Hylemonella sp.]